MCMKPRSQPERKAVCECPIPLNSVYRLAYSNQTLQRPSHKPRKKPKKKTESKKATCHKKKTWQRHKSLLWGVAYGVEVLHVVFFAGSVVFSSRCIDLYRNCDEKSDFWHFRAYCKFSSSSANESHYSLLFFLRGRIVLVFGRNYYEVKSKTF